MKTKTLVLYHPAYRDWLDGKGSSGGRDYREVGYGVASLKNSIAYLPGQFLSKEEVESLCEHSGWEVSIRTRQEKDPIL